MVTTKRQSDDNAEVVLPKNPNFAAMKSAGKCLQCGPTTGKDAERRGCCMTCYNRTRGRIRAHEHSDAAAVVAGYLLAERKKGGRKATSVDPIGEFLSLRKAELASVAVANAVKELKTAGTNAGTPKNRK